MEWLNLMPPGVALGMVWYVNHRIEKHEKDCPIHKQLEDLNKKVDMVLECLLNNKGG